MSETDPSWDVIGGESGPGPRLMSLDWGLEIGHQISEAGGAVFWKQLGGVQAQRWGLVDGKGGDW